MSEIPDVLKSYIEDYMNKQVADPARLAKLVDYCLTIPCPSCHAAVGDRCYGSGAHAGRLSRYIAVEFTTTYAACEGIDG